MMPRRGRRAPTRSSSRLASLCFGIGCLAVLGATFALGVAAGRRWPTGLPLPGLRGAPAATAAAPAVTAAVHGERDAPRRPENRGFDKDKVKTTGEGIPVLTFYHELTAPLASPPPPPPRSVVRPQAASLVEPPPREKIPPAPAAPPVAEPRFTVQVGAFKLRSQAEALRTRLADRGEEAYVTEVETGGVTQYRVRVGTFVTREAARDAAGRLGTERRLATYVTTR
jgi:cell division protein FtsN